MNILDELLHELKMPEPCNLEVEYSGTGYMIEKNECGTRIVCRDNVQLARALVELKKHSGENSFTAGGSPCFKSCGPMFDVSRNGVLKVGTVKKLIRLSALMGYNVFMLYMEDIYPMENRPYFGYLRGRYSKTELKEIDDYAAALDIEVIPCIQTLAHLATVKKWWTLGDMFDVNDILLCDDEKTYNFIADMFASLKGIFRSKRINIGMDEASMIGLGKYLSEHGYVDKFSLMSRHLTRVARIAAEYGFEPAIWSDMFFRLANDGDYYGTVPVPENVKETVPENVALVYWDYRSTDAAHYERMLREHFSFNRRVWMAGIAWKCIGFAPHNLYSFKVADALFEALYGKDIDLFMVTCWGDNGSECSVFSALPALVYLSHKCYGSGEKNEFYKTFKAITDYDVEDFLLLDELNFMGKEDSLTVECPSKYFLYSDLFCGFLDSRCEEQFPLAMTALSDKLQKVKDGEYRYIFDTALALSRVLEIKLGLGIATRDAYKRKDKIKLKYLADNVYPELSKRIRAFHSALKMQWFAENKQNGFEIQDIRLGGLIQRVETCMDQLRACIENNVVLYELEEDILPFIWKENEGKRHMDILNWSYYVTVNNI